MLYLRHRPTETDAAVAALVAKVAHHVVLAAQYTESEDIRFAPLVLHPHALPFPRTRTLPSLPCSAVSMELLSSVTPLVVYAAS
jgi:hypothetical protein